MEMLRGAGLTDLERVVVVGDVALQLASKRAIAPAHSANEPQPVTVCVDPDTYTNLRDNGWDTLPHADDTPALTKGNVVARTHWGDNTHEQLFRRSWKSEGLYTASIPHTLAKQYADTAAASHPNDSYWNTVLAAREWLVDPDSPPLAAEVLTHEIEIVRNTLPAHIRDLERAQPFIHAAAQGLLISSALYGDRDIGTPQPIIGELEHRDYGVKAFYHNAFSMVRDLELLQQHFDNLEEQSVLTPEERVEACLVAMVGETFADSCYGNGRRSNNPLGHDELRSARLAQRITLQLTHDVYASQRVYNVVYGTTFREGSPRELGWDSPDIAAQACSGIDLQILSEPESLEAAVELLIEDLLSARHSSDRALGQFGRSFDSVEEALVFINDHADEIPDGMTISLRQAVANRLMGNAVFHRIYEPPETWTLDRPDVRYMHAARSEELADLFLRQLITASELYELARMHTVHVLTYMDSSRS